MTRNYSASFYPLQNVNFRFPISGFVKSKAVTSIPEFLLKCRAMAVARQARMVVIIGIEKVLPGSTRSGEKTVKTYNLWGSPLRVYTFSSHFSFH